jgi:Tfp pilus assembly protein PilX
MISKLQLEKSSIISKAENEKGVVFIAAIGLIAILALFGTVAVITTSTEIIISKNHKTSVQAFYAAQAGTEEARARLRWSSSDPNYAGDPAANPDPTWSAYILTSSSWQTSDDPNYVDTYTNYIPITSNHTNTTIETNTLQATPDISYWVKIRHKREADLLPFEPYTDYGTTNDIIYYGYSTPTSTLLEQFTSDDNPVGASPVEIITSYGSSSKSAGNIEIQTKKATGPPVISAVYGDTVDINGNVDVTGDDDPICSSNSLPCVGYTSEFEITGEAYTPTSAAGESIVITPALEFAAQVDALELSATMILDDNDDPLQNFTVGSSSNYVVVFCDATQLSDSMLDFENLTGYGTLVIRGNASFGGNLNWNGLIICDGSIEMSGGGNKEIYGAVMAQDIVQLSGNIIVNYNSCELKKAKGGFLHDTFRWEDKKLN